MSDDNKPDLDMMEQRIQSASISDMMEDNFLRYSLSVIVSRALPDVRDGLKPVQRRILYSMSKNGIRSGGKTVKSARIIGDVMGKYHPHGDSAIYDAMARLAVDWSTRYLLIIGQGSFGTMDGDPPAADRYTEAKLSKHAEALLEDLDKETVDFRANYDGTETEPEVLPANLPNLLVNGQIGIAVGMATSIPPHNIKEVVDASLHLADNPDSSVEDLLQYIKGPDFPTGGIVYAAEAMKAAYATGKGSVIIRARATIEERNKQGAKHIIVNEIPYGVNMSTMMSRMINLVRDKKLTSIVDIRDESSRNRVRLVIDLKKDAYADKVLNQLYKSTPLQTSFHYNMLALIDGIQPRVLNLLEMLTEHLKHRCQVVRRRTEFELRKAQERAHIVEGLVMALDQIDAVIATIRASKTVDIARSQLMSKFKLSEKQANAILAMQLRTLAALERQKLVDELEELRKRIQALQKILSSEKEILKVVKSELKALGESFADKRRSKVVKGSPGQFTDEDLIPNEPMLITLTSMDYIKRTASKEYKRQGRGGKGRRGMKTRDRDHIQQLLSANTHADLLFFTNTGRVFKLKCYEVPVSGRDARGVNIVNLLAMQPDENISAMLRIDQDITKSKSNGHLFMCTEQGVVKKTALHLYKNLRQNGLITINLDKGDQLKWVRLSSGQDEVIISTAQGQANRFKEVDVRSMGRAARGVRGIKLRPGDHVVGMDIVKPNTSVFVLSQNGFGKRTRVDLFPVHRRGGQGVRSAIINKKTGSLALARSLGDLDEEVTAISAKGKALRIKVKDVRRFGRATKGIRLMRLDKDDKVTSLAVLRPEQGQEEAPKKTQVKPSVKKSK